MSPEVRFPRRSLRSVTLGAIAFYNKWVPIHTYTYHITVVGLVMGTYEDGNVSLELRLFGEMWQKNISYT